jgi:hypothetical protein
MKKIFFYGILLSIFFAGISASAHQPRLVGGETDITVENPGVSQAFYGTLIGSPVNYHISSPVPFRLYVSLLVPDIEGVDKDISAAISKEGADGPYTDLSFLDGTQHEWTRYFEDFAGDYYWQGPEKTIDAEAGEYTVMVFSQDNQGKYVFVVGEKESFPLSEMIRTIGVLPSLKMDFFGKPWYLAFYNLTGLFLLGVLVVVGVVVAAGVLFFRFLLRRSREKRAQQSSKNPGAV